MSVAAICLVLALVCFILSATTLWNPRNVNLQSAGLALLTLAVLLGGSLLV